MKLAICQINPSLGDFEKNKIKILEYVERSKDLNANIIVFPELSLCGYPPMDLIWDKGFIEQNNMALNEIASVSNIPIILGCFRYDGNKFFNSAAICYENKLKEYYDKILLPNYDVFDEERFFTKGSKPKNVSIPVNGQMKKIGVQICEDLWDKNYSCKVSSEQQKMGAELIINISASPFRENKIQERKLLVSSKAKKIGLPFVYCNMIGGQDELIFDGSSFAVSADGVLLSQAKSFNEELHIIDLNLSKRIKCLPVSREKEIFNALCLGVKDYFSKTNHKKAIIGLSGGIDSALVASIAVNALGNKNVYGFSLPSKFSSEHSLNDAKELATNLEIEHQVIKIHSLVSNFNTTLKTEFEKQRSDIAEENIQSRVRGSLLMTLANMYGWLVLSTGNKTEIALGYCTLYGDMIGALSVIADLSKNDVYKLANWINKNIHNYIPINSIIKPPSAELSPNQVDPYDYSVVSPIVDEIIEKQKPPSLLIEEGFEKKLVHEIYNKIKNSEYKRRQAPLGLRVTSKAFGIGRRYPIVNNYNV